MSDTPERLAYEISLRALERQETLLEEFLSRTGTLLAASSVSASFLGARALDASGFRWLGLIALSLFGKHDLSPRGQRSWNCRNSAPLSALDRDFPRPQRSHDRPVTHPFSNFGFCGARSDYPLEHRNCELKHPNSNRFPRGPALRLKVLAFPSVRLRRGLRRCAASSG